MCMQCTWTAVNRRSEVPRTATMFDRFATTTWKPVTTTSCSRTAGMDELTHGMAAHTLRDARPSVRSPSTSAIVWRRWALTSGGVICVMCMIRFWPFTMTAPDRDAHCWSVVRFAASIVCCLVLFAMCLDCLCRFSNDRRLQHAKLLEDQEPEVGWQWEKNYPDLPLPFKMHEIRSDDSEANC